MTDFDGQRLAADLSPCQPGNHTDLILAFDLAIAEFADAGIAAEIFDGDVDALALPETISFTALRARLASLALQITNARLARVIADQVAHSRVGDLPLIILQAMRLICFGIRWRLAISTFSSSV